MSGLSDADKFDLLMSAVRLDTADENAINGHSPETCASILCNTVWYIEGVITKEEYEAAVSLWKDLETQENKDSPYIPLRMN